MVSIFIIQTTRILNGMNFLPGAPLGISIDEFLDSYISNDNGFFRYFPEIF